MIQGALIRGAESMRGGVTHAAACKGMTLRACSRCLLLLRLPLAQGGTKRLSAALPE
jgi:hypothetical protein